jgi:hypothetical protein
VIFGTPGIRRRPVSRVSFQGSHSRVISSRVSLQGNHTFFIFYLHLCHQWSKDWNCLRYHWRRLSHWFGIGA